MKKVRRLGAYLAAPLFNPQEREFNARLEKQLTPLIEVFLPQRDGELVTRLVAQGRSVDVAQKIVFSKDIAAIERSDLVVAVLDGRTVDEGVAFEIGYARARGKSCIGFKSDDRSMLPTGDNPMIKLGCQHNCSTIDELVDTVRSCVASILDVEFCRCTSAELPGDGELMIKDP